MKVLITGSRHWTNIEQLEERLYALMDEHPDNLWIAHGASKGGGVDLFVANFCFREQVSEAPYPVRKDLDGDHRGAPLNRNKRMVRVFAPDLVLAFRSAGKSNGTDQTVEYASKRNIRIERIEETT